MGHSNSFCNLKLKNQISNTCQVVMIAKVFQFKLCENIFSVKDGQNVDSQAH